MKRKFEKAYEAEFGSEKLAKQKAAAERCCPYCWAEPDTEHFALCPNAEPVEQVEVPVDEQASLF